MVKLEVMSATYLASEIGGSTLRHLQDNRGLLVTGSFERSNNGRGGGDIDSRNGELLFLGVLEEVQDIIPHNHTSLSGQDVFGTHFVDLFVSCVMMKGF
jgi:hypothetical protein